MPPKRFGTRRRVLTPKQRQQRLEKQELKRQKRLEYLRVNGIEEGDGKVERAAARIRSVRGGGQKYTQGERNRNKHSSNEESDSESERKTRKSEDDSSDASTSSSDSSSEASSSSDASNRRDRAENIIKKAQLDKQAAAKRGIPKSAYGYDWKIVEKLVNAVYQNINSAFRKAESTRTLESALEADASLSSYKKRKLLSQLKDAAKVASPPSKKQKLQSKPEPIKKEPSSPSKKQRSSSKTKDSKANKKENGNEQQQHQTFFKSSTLSDPLAINWHEVQQQMQIIAPFTIAELKSLWRFVAYGMDEYGNGVRKRLNILKPQTGRIAMSSDDDRKENNANNVLDENDLSDIDASLPVTTFIKFPRPQYIPRSRLLKPFTNLEKYPRKVSLTLARKKMMENPGATQENIPWSDLEAVGDWNEQCDVMLAHSVLLYRDLKRAQHSKLLQTDSKETLLNQYPHAAASQGVNSASSTSSPNPDSVHDLLRVFGIPAGEEEWTHISRLLEGRYHVKRKAQFCHDRFAIIARTALTVNRDNFPPLKAAFTLDSLPGRTLSEQLRLCILQIADVPQEELDSWVHLPANTFQGVKQ